MAGQEPSNGATVSNFQKYVTGRHWLPGMCLGRTVAQHGMAHPETPATSTSDTNPTRQFLCCMSWSPRRATPLRILGKENRVLCELSRLFSCPEGRHILCRGRQAPVWLCSICGRPEGPTQKAVVSALQALENTDPNDRGLTAPARGIPALRA